MRCANAFPPMAQLGAPDGAGGNVTFGPWRDGLSDAERDARRREIRALALAYLGPGHPVTRALAAGGDDPAALAQALAEMEALPSLRRRRLLAVYAELRA